MHVETLAVRVGRTIDPCTRAVAPTIVLSTTFERAEDGSYPSGFTYARSDNPTRRALEQALAALEGGAVAAAFSSGNAATAAILSALQTGDHVVLPEETYHGTRLVATQVLARWGLHVSFADFSDPSAVQRAIQPNTRLVWVETPSNPTLRVTDIARVAEIAHAAGALCACDNTFATPALQQPLKLGADLVMHSTTKYIGGHSDVLGGVVVGREDSAFFQRVRDYQALGGASPSAFDCWLLLRSLPTLPLRIRAQSESAMRVAEFLASHPVVAKVHYPGLPRHPGHAVACRQMRGGFGGVVSFEVHGGAPAAMAVAAAVRVFTRATSLGCVESLIEHRASIPDAPPGIPPGLLRLSIGLEHPDDLIADLAQALSVL
ncbi:MAG: PLP-dependent aspartate aminotransferase family protein [Anaerolineae bacterium]|nr:PLP-dependent aspartate aminotransferase family protein [Thermoflexales bacterium]MDW8395660.1 PLP-dependent aspartate aminotransferase family protein [Anaerolineae bacterium]